MNLKMMANAVRMLSVDMVSKANSGHPGAPLGMADVLTVLWTRFLNFDAAVPDWANRDRFILSNGHGCAALYSLLYLTGFQDATIEELKNFRQYGSKTPGHPEYGFLKGVEFTTGPLGQGIAGGVGMAIAERMMNARFPFVSHKTYVMAGDGCLMEGISEEAISMAGHLKLNNLIVMWDNNSITIDGGTNLSTSTNQRLRFEANGWRVIVADGMDISAIEAALHAAQSSDKPVFIDFKTVIGFGSPKAGTSAVHGSPLKPDEVAATRQNLGWVSAPFEMPVDVLADWRASGARGEVKRTAWESAAKKSEKWGEFKAFLKKGIISGLSDQILRQTHRPAGSLAQDDNFKGIKIFKEKILIEKPKLATRQTSQMALNVLAGIVPNLVGGSADLGASNLTFTSHSKAIGLKEVKPLLTSPKNLGEEKEEMDFSGNYINYGIREHGMAVMMNGMAAYGGFIPYGGTFLNFLDYMKPAVRLSALMGVQVIYVFTHDSIGLGEDGPTHQPIEQLATLRATPGILTFRPCDAIETMECYEIALANTQGPSAFALSRQAVPTLRSDAAENKSWKGAYVLAETQGVRDVTLIATGTEVSLAMDVRTALAGMGIEAAVISMPCMELFIRQTKKYRKEVLGKAPRVVIEAAGSFGWHGIADMKRGMVIGIDHFGASAPGSVVYEKFGFGVGSIVARVRKLLKR